MKTLVPVSKDEMSQSAIPSEWRETLIEIIEALKLKKYDYINSIPNVRHVSNCDLDRIKENIDEYGCEIITLPDESWQTSACQWMSGYWDVLVDLYTVEEGESDLSLVIRVHEKDKSVEFNVISVHVV